LRSSPRPTEPRRGSSSVRSTRPVLLLCLSALCVSILCLPPALSLSSCSPGDRTAEGSGDRAGRRAGNPAGADESEREPSELWFQLRDGRFEQITGPAGHRPTGRRPWTVQERISDMAELDGRPYLAVNGYGVSALTLGPDGFARFQPFYDPLLFAHRTFSRILPQEGSLLCHVYFNSLLNEVSPDRLDLHGVSLMRLFPREGIYRLRTPPFQRRNPDWECVGFVPDEHGQALLSWKHSSPQETRFDYTRLDLEDGTESAAERAEYREAMSFAPLGRGLDAGLRALTKETARRLDDATAPTGVQFLVREKGRIAPRRYQVLPPGFESAEPTRLVLLTVEHRRGRFLLLTPNGQLLQAAEGAGRVGSRRLPSLPEGFVYTDLLLSGTLLIAAWEERDFTDVGAAGVYLWTEPVISP
jgi:hypothetical protein